jgi:RNA polymerase sigma-70 factor (ECF subfamily)
MTEPAADDTEKRHAGALRPYSQESVGEALLRQIAGGDQQALGNFYDTTIPQVYGLALRILGNRAAAEEVTLDVYTQVWRQAVNYNAQRGTPATWLSMLTRSRALDRLRTSRQEEQRLAAFEKAGAPAPTATPEESSLVVERRRLVQAALTALPTEQREVLELAYFSGLSHGEIAVQLRLPPGTIKTRLRLGLTKLRVLLGTLVD